MNFEWMLLLKGKKRIWFINYVEAVIWFNERIWVWILRQGPKNFHLFTILKNFMNSDQV